nr:TPA_asm: hypothetical protein [Ladona dragonfly adintovirus]
MNYAYFFHISIIHSAHGFNVFNSRVLRSAGFNASNFRVLHGVGFNVFNLGVIHGASCDVLNFHEASCKSGVLLELLSFIYSDRPLPRLPPPQDADTATINHSLSHALHHLTHPVFPVRKHAHHLEHSCFSFLQNLDHRRSIYT